MEERRKEKERVEEEEVHFAGWLCHSWGQLGVQAEPGHHLAWLVVGNYKQCCAGERAWEWLYSVLPGRGATYSVSHWRFGLCVRTFLVSVIKHMT